ncbi:copper amine oxidase N-terminal domain-containing protein, partial [Mycobacterium tuberculosis]|uniref:copper amine oxidase N-terminal domain-containing protein n=1 Tax=Mycobacterium tuberculosis TaxID=1773 RepID=UPI0015870020
IRLDVPARLQKDRVFVPIRFVSEALGADVKWSQANRLVTITTKNTSNPSTPDENTESNNMYGDFQFKSGYTNLAKSLFVNNAKVTNGKLTFTVPKGATATHWTKDMTSTKLVAGKSYTYALGANKGSISVNLVY